MKTPTATRGLYDPRFEHDACGIGFVAHLSGAPSHDVLSKALTAVSSMAHRGGVSADGKSGDGAGVLTQIPRPFFARELARLDINYPSDELAVGMLFLPRDEHQRAAAKRLVKCSLAEHGLALLGCRAVPVDDSALGVKALQTCPVVEQALVGKGSRMDLWGLAYEQALYLARKQIETQAMAQGLDSLAVPSLSSRTLVYKGLLVAPMLRRFYPDLCDPLYETALAVYHQRYSTNTFPTWERAQPFHMLSHNGEINTLSGNVAWMRAREAAWRRAPATCEVPESGLWGGATLATHVARLGPVVDTRGSDSAMLDNVLELIVMGGRDIRHAMAMLVPEAWEQIHDMEPARRAFYEYHAGIMEPWDGPAALAFSDGQIAGLALDRNGLRPARYLVTHDGLVVCGSEAGAVQVDEAAIARKGKLGPGQRIAVDLNSRTFDENEQIVGALAAKQPYAEWLAHRSRSFHVHAHSHSHAADGGLWAMNSEPHLSDVEHANLEKLERAFGYTSEEMTAVLRPMLRDGQEPVGSMGDDTPPAFLSVHSRLLYNYFKQRFAEVTNPPIDPLREQLVMSLSVSLGRRGDLMSETPDHANLLRLASPVLTDGQFAAIRDIQDPAFAGATLHARFPVQQGPTGMSLRLDQLAREAEESVTSGTSLLVISDRSVDQDSAPIPALLALGAIHHHLIHCGLRRDVSLIVESGEPRSVHDLACLVGMGAEAVNPYLALAAAREIADERGEMRQRKAAPSGAQHADDPEALSPERAERNYVRALEKGLLKIMSKMGIATVDSYCGAQLFEAIGLAPEVVQRCFSGVPARLGGVAFEELAAEALEHHSAAFSGSTTLPNPGFYKYKKDGEYHAFSPAVVHALQKAVGGDGDYEAHRAYSQLVHSRPPTELRDLLDFAPDPQRPPVPLEEVEPVDAIVRRFSTAAMSHGSTSSEAHETIAVAMNRLGGLSNSGEGGEDPARFGDERNSPIKQVASARFGVTPLYLMSAVELQIKMAQGSKPGEGGQLPAHKVSDEIARIRHTPAGIDLISPPPHHDIYSIEDLAQLIYDLKQINPGAAVSVKLVAQAGVGTIAAGVAKGGADVILISGHSGGTGASPLSSIKNAGAHWELGLAETQQTLVMNGLRGRVRLRADGGLKTGRDVVMAALLGADEYSFGTAALVAEGCLMARTCHTNNCPVGIATQRPELRAKFTGTPEQVMHFFLHLAQVVREILASLGARSLDEIVGRADLLRQVRWGRDELHSGAEGFDLSALLERVDDEGQAIRNTAERNGRVTVCELNARLLKEALPALERGERVELSLRITSRDRTVGATLSGVVAARYGPAGLPGDTIKVTFRGSAGQSFGAFLMPGLHLLLEGEANDYVGKGMSGGEIVVRPPKEASYRSHTSALVGNTVLYGATGGAVYLAGRAGERFAVRNSGALAVVEGVGDHGCEYMTGGQVLVLGTVGRNFGAGMTGGVAYVYDEDGALRERCNHDLVELKSLSKHDEESIVALLVRHLELTGSRRADELLLGWEVARERLWRVQPKGKGAAVPVVPVPQPLQIPERPEETTAA